MPAQNASQDDPYNVFDQDSLATSPASKAQTPSQADVVNPLTIEPAEEKKPVDRPRRPDGTFAPKQEHSPELVDIAKRNGITEEEISGTTSEGLAERIEQRQRMRSIAERQRLLDERAERMRAVEQEQHPQQDHFSPVESPATPPQLPKAKADDDLAYLDQFVEETGFDPKIAAIIKKMASRIAQLEQHSMAIGQRILSREQKEFDNNIDQAFSMLKGNGREQWFATDKAMDELAKDSPERKRRMAMIGAVCFANGIKPEAFGRLPVSKMLRLMNETDAAPRSLSPETPPQSQPKPAAPVQQAIKPPYSEEQWNAGALAMPTDRGDEDIPLGRERAIRSVAKKTGQQADFRAALEDQEILNGFPE